MKMLTIKDIIEHPFNKAARKKAVEIDEKVNGRMCLADTTHYLLTVREILGQFCKRYLEIGVLHGGTMALVLSSSLPTEGVGIDIFTYYGNKKDPNTHPPTNVSFDNAVKNVMRCEGVGSFCSLLEGNSHNKDTVRWVREVCEDFQLVFIDGDHTEEGVVADWDNYSPMVSPGGVVVFDNYGDPAHWKGVKKSVDKIDFTGWSVIGQIGFMFLVQRKYDE